MNQKEKEQVERQKNLNQFNNVTQKVKPENQNQTHNVRKGGERHERAHQKRPGLLFAETEELKKTAPFTGKALFFYAQMRKNRIVTLSSQKSYCKSVRLFL